MSIGRVDLKHFLYSLIRLDVACMILRGWFVGFLCCFVVDWFVD